MDSFVDMLWDQDVDMGVDRYFYDPVLREQHVKKQEAEQNKLQELKRDMPNKKQKDSLLMKRQGSEFLILPHPLGHCVHSVKRQT
ncbi:hypothetical protein EB796_002529 [Bugula neritina]|uniref:Uncharacterized protein n=1 Tax=Bugula neritina TaxID=10212 RepID=A0A7J7KLY2_BUGNE|nr:hypothetical protein EB796_002529 [Bugula neritina]